MGAFGAALGDLGVGLEPAAVPLGLSALLPGPSCTKFPIGAMPNSFASFGGTFFACKVYYFFYGEGNGLSGAFASGSAFGCTCGSGTMRFLLGLHGIVFFQGLRMKSMKSRLASSMKLSKSPSAPPHKAVEVTEAVVVCGMGTLLKAKPAALINAADTKIRESRFIIRRLQQARR